MFVQRLTKQVDYPILDVVMKTHADRNAEALVKEAIVAIFENNGVDMEDWAENAYMNVRRFGDDPTVMDIVRLVQGTLFRMAQEAVGQEWEPNRNF